MPPVTSPFGAMLVEAMQRRGLSVRAFARGVGVSEGLVRMVIRGDRRPPLDRLGQWIACVGADGTMEERLCAEALAAHGALWLAERLAGSGARRAAQPATGYDGR